MRAQLAFFDPKCTLALPNVALADGSGGVKLVERKTNDGGHAQSGERARISFDEYRDHLAPLQHLFLVGDLQKPTPPVFRDARLELILCTYEAGDDGLFHWHEEVTEYEIILEGRVGYQHVSDGRIEWFEPATCPLSRRCVRAPLRADEIAHDCRQGAIPSGRQDPLRQVQTRMHVSDGGSGPIETSNGAAEGSSRQNHRYQRSVANEPS